MSAAGADAFSGERVLITGGLGFIGSTLAIELVRRGAEVTVLDSLVPGHGGNPFNVEPVRERLRIHTSDMRDQEALDVLVRGQRYIFHLAGQVSHGDSMREPKLDLAVNCAATLNLVEACRAFNPEARLVYTSTRQVYGRPVRLPVDEGHPVAPIDVNGINKLAGEYYHLLYDQVYGIACTVLRLTNTYGPRQQIANDRQGFVGVMMRRALLREPIQVFGTGKQRRDLNYVDDVVGALLLAAKSERCRGRVFNLGSPQVHRVLDVAMLLAELCGARYEMVPFPSDRKLVDIGDYYGDYRAFVEATGWQPTTGLRDGMSRTVESYRAHWQHYLE